MSGPIVRTGTTPEFWKNWDRVFAGKSSEAGGAKAKTAKKQVAKAVAPKAAKKPVKKAAKGK